MYFRQIVSMLASIGFAAAQTSLTLPDGGHYEGALVDGLLQGEGALVWPNGDRYDGHFAGGQMQGQGKLTFHNGDLYQGEFRLGEFHGEGHYQLSDGRVWLGRFSAGELVDGELITKAGETYRGQFENWQLQGPGQVVFPDRGTWRGEFTHGRLSGIGTIELTDGTRYEGGIKNWQYHGDGQLTLADGSHYQGGFQWGRYNGQGELTQADGSHYVGGFGWGQYQGQGTLVRADGERQQGEFSAGLLHGEGRIDYANGDWFEGHFSYGKPSGHGTFFTAAEQTEETGRWQNRQLLARDTEHGIQYLGSAVERALYKQPALLQEALDAVLPSDPDQTNLYVLLVAGNGQQRVFRREAMFARQLFAQRYQATGRIIALVNSPQTVDELPMATVSSIEQALQTLAARMDKNNDVLLVFMTSHGSADYTLQLNHQGLSLPGLSAQYLAQIAAETGIQYRVFIISSCYSGGYIEHLKSRTTLVMTAADADRKSFGCSDDAEFTYFGRALLESALGDTLDLRRAFHQAYDLVAKWEADKDYQPSKPQLYAPQPILDKLAAWYQNLPEYLAQPPTAKEQTRWWWRERKILPGAE